jgi:hypothetical protein
MKMDVAWSRSFCRKNITALRGDMFANIFGSVALGHSVTILIRPVQHFPRSLGWDQVLLPDFPPVHASDKYPWPCLGTGDHRRPSEKT